VGAGNDPDRYRYGCFLPDLTGLASGLPARLPRAIWRLRAPGASPADN